MNKPTAQTVFQYWSYFMNPRNQNFPVGYKVETARQPVGLWLTIEKRPDGRYDSYGRSRKVLKSNLADAMISYLSEQYGPLPEGFRSVTLILTHALLPETKSREALIEAFDNDEELNMKYFKYVILSVDSDGTHNWPETTWVECQDPEELRVRYEDVYRYALGTGLLLRVTSEEGRVSWYRRPLEYSITMQVVKINENRLYLEFRNPDDGNVYTGSFKRYEKDVIERLIEETDQLVGKYMEVTTKSVTQSNTNEFQLYAIRYERLVPELPRNQDQFKLV